MTEIYNTIYDIVFSGDYSFLYRLIGLCMSFIIFNAAIRLIFWVFRLIGYGYEDASESDNGKKVDLTKKNEKNNMFTKYYDHYDKD